MNLRGLYDRVKSLGYQLKIATAPVILLQKEALMPITAHRPLKRAIQKYLEDPMAEVLIKANLKEGDIINVGFNSAKSEIKIKIQKKQ